MPYVMRNADGDICGLFEQPQEGFAEELLAADDPAVIAHHYKPLPVVSVSARQFKLQLLAAGLLDSVDAWVAQQPRDVQIAYEYSGTFVRNSTMMAAGFAAMGFTPQQIDGFFVAAAQL
ncbi:hypothetical protein [Rhizobium lentis]|uniref:hypothetical protein n=1 Tax=Rhizobium lentis TaxID=1138194 RepID=UPI001A929687|nr:hypothetical protein [Rhizobium lentis]MBX5063451.1 hypothetical protein [Rhizobium lentis]MBX5075557.1 hypothetical protein [Rhizobium lentis]QSW93203.1 hypothetical protein J0663_19380 [Rhizobium lentis]